MGGNLSHRPREGSSKREDYFLMQKAKRDNMAGHKLTGGSSDYYKVTVERPTSGGDPYVAECNDIIESLNMTFAEGNIFKAVWRRAAAKQGNGKPGNSAQYDAEKIVFFGQRLIEQSRD